MPRKWFPKIGDNAATAATLASLNHPALAVGSEPVVSVNGKDSEFAVVARIAIIVFAKLLQVKTSLLTEPGFQPGLFFKLHCHDIVVSVSTAVAGA